MKLFEAFGPSHRCNEQEQGGHVPLNWRPYTTTRVINLPCDEAIVWNPIVWTNCNVKLKEFSNIDSRISKMFILWLVSSGRIVRGRLTKCSKQKKAFPNGMYIGKIHELDVTLWIILGEFATSAPCPVGNSCCITTSIHNQHFLQNQNCKLS